MYRARLVLPKTATVHVNLVGWWGSRYEKPIYLLSNLANGIRPAGITGADFKSKPSSPTKKAVAFTSTKAICLTLPV